MATDHTYNSIDHNTLQTLGLHLYTTVVYACVSFHVLINTYRIKKECESMHAAFYNNCEWCLNYHICIILKPKTNILFNY